jgi:predicted DNA binding protein
MGSGIRAEVTVDADGTCPISRTATAADSETVSISRSVSPTGGTVSEEFMLEDPPTDDSDVDATEPADLSTVFSYGSRTVYRFERELGHGCPCECVEQFDCPVVDIHTRDGQLYLVFHASDMQTLRDVIANLRDQFSGVDIRRLLREQGDGSEGDLVFVDRGALTARQREVLETAHRMGYFNHPRDANATEVAAALDISPATFAEHLALAQSKLLDTILDG